jgi:hypothetical protein
MRLDSHPEISAGWRRTVAEWYAHGETMDKLGEGIPLGTANRFAASLHVGVGGGSYVEKEDVRRLAPPRTGSASRSFPRSNRSRTRTTSRARTGRSRKTRT